MRRWERKFSHPHFSHQSRDSAGDENLRKKLKCGFSHLNRSLAKVALMPLFSAKIAMPILNLYVWLVSMKLLCVVELWTCAASRSKAEP